MTSLQCSSFSYLWGSADLRLDLPHDAGDEVAGADEGVEDVHALVAEASGRTPFSEFPRRCAP